MQENTFELTPLKSILTKSEPMKQKNQKEWIELPNGWKLLCYNLTLSSQVFGDEKTWLLFLKTLR